MKRVIFFFFLMATVCVNAQTAKSSTNARTNRYEQKVDSLLSEIDSLQSISSRYLEYMAMRFLPKERYKLYQTENIYNVLILDTKTGMIDQVQWSLDSDKEASINVNSTDLSDGYGSEGTYELYPTKNIYQFILLNKINGKKWHVQWGLESSKRWIRRIY